MPPISFASALQLILGLGLLNVWLLRANRATGFRGGPAKSLREEFAVYGLPPWFYGFIGTLKVGSAIALLVGLWVPVLILPAAGVVIALMLGAVAMHVKVKDAVTKTIPAFLMLVMSVTLCVLALP